MFNWFKYFFLFFFSLGLFVFLSPIDVKAASVSGPIIVEINQRGSLNMAEPLIVGLTPKDTEVLIYIDDEFVGFAEVNKSDTATNNFFFRAKTIKEGGHELVAQARDKKTMILSKLTSRVFFEIKPLPGPFLVQPTELVVVEKAKPLVTGLMVSGTRVHVYFDGILDGKTEFITHKSGTANFAYVSKKVLSPGRHSIELLAEDRNGRMSQKLEPIEFFVIHPLPAPVLAEEYSINEKNELTIIGFSKNDLTINVFLDEKLDGEFKAANHESGTANFSYKFSKSLTNEDHAVYVTAIDKKGKKSKWSNVIRPKIIPDKIADPRITPIAAAEEGSLMDGSLSTQNSTEDTGKKENESHVAIIDPEKITLEDIEEIDELSKEIFDSQEKEDTEKKTNDLAKDIIDIPKDENSELEESTDIIVKEKEDDKDMGLINEDKEKQSKLNWNILIFFLFLLAVIGWIFWVNKELIKEKQAKKTSEEEKSSDDEDKNIQNSLDI